MVFSRVRAHTSAKTDADPSKLLLLNKRRLKDLTQWHGAGPHLTPTVTLLYYSNVEEATANSRDGAYAQDGTVRGRRDVGCT